MTQTGVVGKSGGAGGPTTVQSSPSNPTGGTGTSESEAEKNLHEEEADEQNQFAARMQDPAAYTATYSAVAGHASSALPDSSESTPT